MTGKEGASSRSAWIEAARTVRAEAGRKLRDLRKEPEPKLEKVPDISGEISWQGSAIRSINILLMTLRSLASEQPSAIRNEYNLVYGFFDPLIADITGHGFKDTQLYRTEAAVLALEVVDKGFERRLREVGEKRRGITQKAKGVFEHFRVEVMFSIFRDLVLDPQEVTSWLKEIESHSRVALAVYDNQTFLPYEYCHYCKRVADTRGERLSERLEEMEATKPENILPNGAIIVPPMQ